MSTKIDDFLRFMIILYKDRRRNRKKRGDQKNATDSFDHLHKMIFIQLLTFAF